MNRATLNRSLAALAAELDALDRGIRWASLKVGSARSEAERHGKYDDPASRELVTHHRTDAAAQNARRRALASIRARLDVVGAALAQDDAAWSSERAAYQWTVEKAMAAGRTIDPAPAPAPGPTESLAGFRSEMASSMEAMRETVLGAHKARWSADLLSQALPSYLAMKAKTLRTSKHLDTLRPRIELFARTVGDKPVRDYVRQDFEDYRDLLDQTPARWQARFKTTSLSEAIAANARLDRPHPPMEPKSIDDDYLSPLKTFFTALEKASKIERNPGRGVASARTDTQERADEGRLPFSPGPLSTYLAYMARNRSRVSPDYWLPLLALYTGARLNELCQIDPTRVIQRDGVWLIDLLTVLDRDELASLPKPERLKLKSAAARREIPIHEDLVKAGFLELVEGRRKRGGRLFPELKSDAHGYLSTAISKRLNLDIVRAGVKTDRVTFYSLRHNFRSALRNGRVSDLTADRVMGHVIRGAKGHYGSPQLEPAEIEDVRRIAFPGVDISPYLSAIGERRRSRREPVGPVSPPRGA